MAHLPTRSILLSSLFERKLLEKPAVAAGFSWTEFEIGERIHSILESRSEDMSGTHPCGQPQSNSP